MLRLFVLEVPGLDPPASCDHANEAESLATDSHIDPIPHATDVR